VYGFAAERAPSLTLIDIGAREDAVEIPGRLPTPPAEPRAVLQPTIRFQARLPPTIHGKGKHSLDRERTRLAARKKRMGEKERRDRQGSQGVAESPAANSPSVSTPRSTTVKPPAPEKLTKKERERQAKAGQTDELYHKQANATASMALGKSKYAWMNAGTPAAAAPAIGTGAGYHARLSGAGQTAKKPDSTSGPPAGEAGLVAKDSYKKVGLLKEGSGVGMRDLVNVLEREGKENKAILKGLTHLEAKD
jgi:Transcription initiation factor TFIID component TAF4 family